MGLPDPGTDPRYQWPEPVAAEPCQSCNGVGYFGRKGQACPPDCESPTHNGNHWTDCPDCTTPPEAVEAADAEMYGGAKCHCAEVSDDTLYMDNGRTWTPEEVRAACPEHGATGYHAQRPRVKNFERTAWEDVVADAEPECSRCELWGFVEDPETGEKVTCGCENPSNLPPEHGGSGRATFDTLTLWADLGTQIKDLAGVVTSELQALQQERDTLRALLRALHDVTDDVNAWLGTSQWLCLICKATDITAQVGIVHEPDCALLRARAALGQGQEASE